MPDLLLIRHAQAEGQSAEVPLTAAGRDQARKLAMDLAGLPPCRIFCSPYARAIQTIAPFAEARGVAVTTLPGLAERVLSPEPRADWLTHVRQSFDDPDHALPGGESLRQTADRGMAALRSAAATGPSVCIIHGNLIAAVLNRLDPDFGFEGWRGLGNPHVIRVRTQNGVPVSFVA